MKDILQKFLTEISYSCTTGVIVMFALEAYIRGYLLVAVLLVVAVVVYFVFTLRNRYSK